MKKINFFIVAVLLIALQSCLKGRDMIMDPNVKTNIVEFGNPIGLTSAVTDSFRLYTISFTSVPLDTLKIPVNYAGGNKASKDIAVNVILDTTLLKTYNAVKKVSYSLVPNTLYTLPGTVTIKSGTNQDTLFIPVKINQISYTGTYVLPLSISSASGEAISGNFKSIIVQVTPRNIYDGLYSYKATSNISGYPTVNKNGVALKTVNATQVQGSLIATYTGNVVVYQVTPTTNAVTVVNSGGIGTPTTDPSSNYNPITKVLYVKWSAGNYKIEETYTYTGSR